MQHAATLIGLVGVAAVLAAYALVSLGRWAGTQPRYQWLNLAGTFAILYSLLYSWNLPSFIAQCAWIVISIIGLVRIYYRRYHGR
jgi:uncharacterized membrane protein